MAGNLTRHGAPTIHGSVYACSISGKRIKLLSYMPDSAMSALHRIDAEIPAALHIPPVPDRGLDLIAANSEVAKLIVAQFLPQPLLALHGPGAPGRPQQRPRTGQQQIACPAERRFSAHMHPETIGFA